MNEKDGSIKTILIFTDWYKPAYKAGGPIQSVYNLAEFLSKRFLVKIVSRNTDLNSNIEFEGIVPDVWTQIGTNHQVLYLSKKNIGVSVIRKLIKENQNNVIYINGLFSFYFSFLPALVCTFFPIRSIFISVRGMLHQSALSVKPLKKQIFLAFARGFGLYKKPVLIASNADEKYQIERSLGKVNVKIAPNIPLLYRDIRIDEFKRNDVFTILFLGRIAPEKNPISLIKAMKDIDKPCKLLVCGGWNNKSYFDDFMQESKSLPKFVQFEYLNELPHEEIDELLKTVDVMALPSLGENFGHAIFESFVNGVPVIIGNNTPWKGLESKKAGIEVTPDDVSGIRKAILKFIEMGDNEFIEWKKGANSEALRYFQSNNFEEVYFKLFS